MRRRSASAAAAALTAACVMYEPVGPSLPRLAGDYVTTIVLEYENQLDWHRDTLFAVLALPDPARRGDFLGRYHIGGEVGLFGGLLFPSGRLEIPTFGPGSTPIARVTSIRTLYPLCDFDRVGAGVMVGELRGDSLVLDGLASVPCSSSSDPLAVDLTTSLTLRFLGAR